jgi:putative ABC transport system permease protein
VIVSGAATVALFLTSVVFGASLSSLVSTPKAYGWSWDAGIMFNYGYGGIDRQTAANTLRTNKDVESWTELALTRLTLDGAPTTAVIGLDRVSKVDPTMIEGRPPLRDNEVALGARTASDNGLKVGDEVTVAGDFISGRKAKVTGLVVLPALGPYQANRAGPGSGVMLPQAMLDNQSLDQRSTFIGINLTPGTDPDRFIAGLRPTFEKWELSDLLPFSYAQAVEPPEIIDARSMRSFPAIVAGLLQAAGIVMLSTAVALSVRARRRELAVLRTLGFTGRQLRRSVRVQATATTTATVLIGLPLGILAGQVAWRAFAEELGVQPSISLPGWSIAVAVVAPLLIALAAAAVPGHWAARIQPAAALRAE